MAQLAGIAFISNRVKEIPYNVWISSANPSDG